MLGNRAHPGMRFDLFFGRIDPLANELKVVKAREAVQERACHKKGSYS